MLKLPTKAKGTVRRPRCMQQIRDARQLNCIFIYFYLAAQRSAAQEDYPAAADDAISFLLLPQIAVITKTDLAAADRAATDAEPSRASAWMPQEKQEKLLGCTAAAALLSCVCVCLACCLRACGPAVQ